MNQIWRFIAKTSARSWLYLFAVLAVICIVSLRHNNQTMIKLRNDVYVADKSNTNVGLALNSLGHYVHSHMNTNLSSGGNSIKPPIQLKYTYQRLYDAEFNNLQGSNQKIYTDAQISCISQGVVTAGGALVSCVQNYALNHGVKDASVDIPAGLYEFDFVSPAWSPDLAGFSLILAIVCLAVFLVKFGNDKLRN